MEKSTFFRSASHLLLAFYTQLCSEYFQDLSESPYYFTTLVLKALYRRQMIRTLSPYFTPKSFTKYVYILTDFLF